MYEYLNELSKLYGIPINVGDVIRESEEAFVKQTLERKNEIITIAKKISPKDVSMILNAVNYALAGTKIIVPSKKINDKYVKEAFANILAGESVKNYLIARAIDEERKKDLTSYKETVIENTKKLLSGIKDITWGFFDFFKFVFSKEGIENLGKTIQDFILHPEKYADILTNLNKLIKDHPYISYVLFPYFAILLFGESLKVLMINNLSRIEARLNKDIPYRYPELSLIIESLYRGLITQSKAIEYLGYQGYMDETIKLILECSERILAPETLLELSRRKLLSENELEKYLRMHRFNTHFINLLRELRWYLPSASDWIRFAVRDALSEEVVRKYGYDEGIREIWEQYGKEIEKSGLKFDTFKLYWRSHWNLPSPSMAYAMFQRGIIDRTDLETLLKIADYPKYWREKLIKLSYNPITRVDIRRMYEIGTITSDTELKKRYMAVGYSPEDAELMVKWTKKEVLHTEMEKIKKEAEKQFKLYLINEDELKEIYRELDIPGWQIPILIAKVKYERHNEYIKEVVKHIKYLYIYNYINRDETINRLVKLGFNASYITFQIDRWTLEKDRKRAKFTKEEIKKMYLKKIISKEQAIEFLEELHYTVDRAKLLIRLWESEGGKW